MPMIACQECSNQISSLSKVCIHCGAPIAQDTSVKIKLIVYDGFWFGNARKVDIVDANGKTLWSGVSGSVAVFNINEPTNIKIVVKGVHTTTEGNVFPGKRYQVKLLGLWNVDTKTILVEVDVINSD